ncbi:hypothetical protein J3F84DRAFT_235597 [Trichoderma pleuroticola]
MRRTRLAAVCPPRTSLAASSPPCGRHAGYQQLGHGGLSPDCLSPLDWAGAAWPPLWGCSGRVGACRCRDGAATHTAPLRILPEPSQTAHWLDCGVAGDPGASGKGCLNMSPPSTDMWNGLACPSEPSSQPPFAYAPGSPPRLSGTFPHCFTSFLSGRFSFQGEPKQKFSCYHSASTSIITSVCLSTTMEGVIGAFTTFGRRLSPPRAALFFTSQPLSSLISRSHCHLAPHM